MTFGTILEFPFIIAVAKQKQGKQYKVKSVSSNKRRLPMTQPATSTALNQATSLYSKLLHLTKQDILHESTASERLDFAYTLSDMPQAAEARKCQTPGTFFGRPPAGL
jgi:hypothetical protein